MAKSRQLEHKLTMLRLELAEARGGQSVRCIAVGASELIAAAAMQADRVLSSCALQAMRRRQLVGPLSWRLIWSSRSSWWAGHVLPWLSLSCW